MPERLDESDLKALVDGEIRSSIAYDRTELSEKRVRAMEYYRGEMADTPAAPNRSCVTSNDVADTIGWMLPGIIRVFTASDQMAVYDPVKPGDEPGAKQATDYCNHIFWKDNPGYRILWNSTHDSLLQGNGIVKHYWDAAEECEYADHSGLTVEQIALLQQDGVEIIAQSPGEMQKVAAPGPNGQMVEQEVQTFNIKTKRIERSGRVRVEAIEPENFLLDKDAITIENARFCAHRDEKTRSELIEMGFDREIVDSLPAYSNASGFIEEDLVRQEEYDGLNDTGHESMDLIELYECYVRADMDGDGIAETVRCYFAGNGGAGELLDWEVWDDDVPFSDIPCEPVPHRWDARSVADETMDVQRIKTVLLRQMLDNLYASNMPMREAEVGSVINPEMLASPVFGGTIWRKAGSQPVVPHVVPFVADKSMVALEYFDTVVEKRTGVSRSTMALDPEALQNQTATASQNQRDAAYSQIELIARNQAELGWRRVFRQILRLTIKHQDRPRVIRLRDEWVEIDPRHWNADMDVTINVGLGTGSRERDMSMLNVVLQGQIALADRAMQGGAPELALDLLPRIIKTLTKIAESSGLKNADEHYPKIGPEQMQAMMQKIQQQQSQPDPKVQMEQQKLQFEMQKGQMEIQADQQKIVAENELKRQQMDAELQLKREQLVAEMGLKREQLAAELQLKREMAVMEMQVRRETGFMGAAAKASSATSRVHMGGDPG